MKFEENQGRKRILINNELVNLDSPELIINKAQKTFQTRTPLNRNLSRTSETTVTPVRNLNISWDDNFTNINNDRASSTPEADDNRNIARAYNFNITEIDNNDQNIISDVEQFEDIGSSSDSDMSTDSDNENMPEIDYQEELESRLFYYASFVYQEDCITREVEGCDDLDGTMQSFSNNNNLTYTVHTASSEDRASDVSELTGDICFFLSSSSTNLREFIPHASSSIWQQSEANRSIGNILSLNQTLADSEFQQSMEADRSIGNMLFLNQTLGDSEFQQSMEANKSGDNILIDIDSECKQSMESNQSAGNIFVLNPTNNDLEFEQSISVHLHDETPCCSSDSLTAIASSTIERDVFSLDDSDKDSIKFIPTNKSNILRRTSTVYNLNDVTIPSNARIPTSAPPNSPMTPRSILKAIKTATRSFTKRSKDQSNADDVEIHLLDKRTVAKKMQRFRDSFRRKDKRQIKTLANL
ncbi:uncharacterized protein LOC134696245 [Mytilus trossulus]|uniref:uncharacterized protein LOC134696245 n=1 Tax=Mytilus trossulus TaxID=6551 RepID=UPI003004B62B